PRRARGPALARRDRLGLPRPPGLARAAASRRRAPPDGGDRDPRSARAGAGRRRRAPARRPRDRPAAPRRHERRAAALALRDRSEAGARRSGAPARLRGRAAHGALDRGRLAASARHLPEEGRMSFQHPVLLIALLIVPAAVVGWIWLERRRSERAAAWSSPALLPNMLTSRPGRRRFVPLVLFLVGLTLLLAGFARPEATLTVPREGATVVLALDVSGSMAAKDVKPTRLAAADAAVAQFVKDLPSKYRVALVTFSSRPTVKVPPTYDHKLILQALPSKTELEGSAGADGAATAGLVASKAVGKSKPGAPHPPAAVLLLSDGAQNSGRLKPADAIAQARKLDVPVSTIALGTADGMVYQKLPGSKYTEQHAVPA